MFPASTARILLVVYLPRYTESSLPPLREIRGPVLLSASSITFLSPTIRTPNSLTAVASISIDAISIISFIFGLDGVLSGC